MRVGVNARLLLGDKMEGIARYIYETTMEMAKQHPKSQFFLFFDRKITHDFGFPDNVKSVIVPWHARHPILWWWWFECMIPLYLKWFKIDVFYSADGYMSLSTKIPTVMAIHDLAYLHFPQHVPHSSLGYYQKNVPKFLSNSKIIVTVSDYVKNDIIKQFNTEPNKIIVAGNAISELPNFASIIIPDIIKNKLFDHPYFIYIGALHPRKNIENLIKAFNHFNLDHPEYKLILAGRLAWKTDQIEALIQTSPNVIYTGMVNDEEKYWLLSHAKALTYISHFEGFGIPLLEAMAVGTPVITSCTTSMPEVAGNAALLVNPIDVSDIEMAMKKIATNEDLCNQLIEKGLQRVKEFSWNESAQIIYKALQNVAKYQ